MNEAQKLQWQDMERKLLGALHNERQDALMYMYGNRPTKNTFEHKSYPPFPIIIKSRTEEPMPELSQTDRMWEQEANRSLSLLGTLIPNRGVHSHNVETVYNEHMQALIRAKQDYDTAVAERTKRETDRRIAALHAAIEHSQRELEALQPPTQTPVAPTSKRRR